MNIFPVPKRINETAVDALRKWLHQAERGELQSVMMVGIRDGGEWQTAASESASALMDAAMLMELAMRRMGFALKDGQ